MNRDKIKKFADKFSNICVCGGEGKEHEAFCWYLLKNQIAYNLNIEENFEKNDTGIFMLLNDKQIYVYERDLLKKGFENFFYLSKPFLRELRCIKSITAPGDEQEAKLILDAVEYSLLEESVVNQCTYAGLAYIKNFYAQSTYLKAFRAVCNYNKKTIDKKDKIKIGFLIKHSSEWSAQSIYKYLSQSDRNELTIFVAPYFVGTKKSIMDNYYDTLSYFSDNQYSVIGMYDEESNSYIKWNENNTCDYIFNLTPNFIWLRQTSCIVKFPLRTLNIYIPYGYYISGLVESQFNQLSHHLFWKIFCESMLHKEMANNYSDIGDINVEFSGYLKMDTFLNKDKIFCGKLWSIPDDCDENKLKKIIYAPHWSIGNSKTAFGSFDKIYDSIYEFAKQTKEYISWIIKPHPRLRSECVVQGIFADETEYDVYLDKWNGLENARAITTGIYYDIFMDSDAMVLDSISFLAEYMYVHKPMIFLEREGQTLNEFGIKLVQTLYKVDGADIDAIKRAVYEIVVNELDDRKHEREEFYEKYLDYYSINGQSCTDYIIKFL